jgi:hypothetical protein
MAVDAWRPVLAASTLAIGASPGASIDPDRPKRKTPPDPGPEALRVSSIATKA